jgi:GxxExxY protein
MMDELTYQVRGCIFEVHKELGPGLLESVYESALVYELTTKGLNVQAQSTLPVKYKSIELLVGFRLDILVEGKVIIEVKSVDQLHDVHKKQLLTYLKIANKQVGFLVNFNSVHLKDKESLIRLVNNYSSVDSAISARDKNISL